MAQDTDIQMYAAGLGGTAEPPSTVLLAAHSAQQMDPDFWDAWQWPGDNVDPEDWANQFWDWANNSNSAAQRSLPPPPPPLLPSGEAL